MGGVAGEAAIADAGPAIVRLRVPNTRSIAARIGISARLRATSVRRERAAVAAPQDAVADAARGQRRRARRAVVGLVGVDRGLVADDQSVATSVSLTLAGVRRVRRTRPEPWSTARCALKPKNARPRRLAKPGLALDRHRPPVRPLAHVARRPRSGSRRSGCPGAAPGPWRRAARRPRPAAARSVRAAPARRGSGRSWSHPAPRRRAAGRRTGGSSAGRPAPPRARDRTARTTAPAAAPAASPSGG